MAQNADNPFLKPYNTKYDIPPFEKIKTGDFIPAIKAGIEEQKQNLFAITANRATPDFDNTILPLENLSPSWSGWPECSTITTARCPHA